MPAGRPAKVLVLDHTVRPTLTLIRQANLTPHLVYNYAQPSALTAR
jgi:hypothetical protein